MEFKKPSTATCPSSKIKFASSMPNNFLILQMVAL